MGAARGLAIEKKRHRDEAMWKVMAHVDARSRKLVKAGAPCLVDIVRIAPGRFDNDNAVASAKALRDGIADAFTIQDNAPNISFEYHQTRDGKRYAATVVITVIERKP